MFFDTSGLYDYMPCRTLSHIVGIWRVTWACFVESAAKKNEINEK